MSKKVVPRLSDELRIILAVIEAIPKIVDNFLTVLKSGL